MSFILRFQTRIGLSRMFAAVPFGQRKEVVTLGTQTVTEVQAESADSDPVTRRFETFPKVALR